MRNDFESNYLIHWGLKKGAKKEGHKYYERVEKNGKYLYFYTQAEYEAWLHKGNSALEGAKDKAKGLLDKAKSKLSSLAKDSNSKTQNRITMTRQNLVNAVNVGYGQTTNLIAKAQKTLTSSNAKSVIDRGNKAISSILNTTVNKAQSTTSSLQKNLKATSASVQNKAKSISQNVERTIKQAGKDTSKVVNSYISKGEKAIKNTLSKASNISLSNASKKYGGVGTIVLAALAATAAVATVAKIVYDKIEEKRWERYWENQRKIREREKNEREAAGRKKEIDARNEARKVEQRRRELQEGLQKMFSKDAKDSVKEDYIKHNDIPVKKEEMSRNDDMLAVNQNNLKVDYDEVLKLNDEYKALYEKYEETGDYSYYERAEEIYEEFYEKYANNCGYLNNCANCTLTYDLRRRGYDVDAPWNHDGTLTETITDWYKMDPEKDVEYWDSNGKSNNWQPFTKEEATEIVQFMTDQYPEGAYGHFLINWSEGGGHDCVWSKEGGKIVIRDCQSGKVVNPQEYLQRSYSLSYFRADDKELSDKVYDNVSAETVGEHGNNADNDYWIQEQRKLYENYKRKSK